MDIAVMHQRKGALSAARASKQPSVRAVCSHARARTSEIEELLHNEEAHRSGAFYTDPDAAYEVSVSEAHSG